MFFEHEVQPLSDTWGVNGKITINAILNHFDNVAMQHAALTGDDVLERSRNAVNWVMTGWDIDCFFFIIHRISISKQQ